MEKPTKQMVTKQVINFSEFKQGSPFKDQNLTRALSSESEIKMLDTAEIHRIRS